MSEIRSRWEGQVPHKVARRAKPPPHVDESGCIDYIKNCDPDEYVSPPDTPLTPISPPEPMLHSKFPLFRYINGATPPKPLNPEPSLPAERQEFVLPDLAGLNLQAPTWIAAETFENEEQEEDLLPVECDGTRTRKILKPKLRVTTHPDTTRPNAQPPEEEDYVCTSLNSMSDLEVSDWSDAEGFELVQKAEPEGTKGRDEKLKDSDRRRNADREGKRG